MTAHEAIKLLEDLHAIIVAAEVCRTRCAF
jgi:hypothetical protein